MLLRHRLLFGTLAVTACATWRGSAVTLPNTSLATLPVVYLGGAAPTRTDADIARLSRLRAVAIEKWEGPCWNECITNQSHVLPCLPSCDEEKHQLATLSAIREKNPATVNVMYFNTFMAFPFYAVFDTLVARGLLLRNTSGDVVVIANDNGMEVTIPDFGQPGCVDVWMQVMTNATATGIVDGFYADKFQVVFGADGLVPGKHAANHGEQYVSPATAAAWNAGHAALLQRMVATFGPKSMLLHLTATTPNEFWGRQMTPMEVYTQLLGWVANRTTPYAWIHPLGDDTAVGTMSGCTDAQLVGFLLAVEEGAFLSCQGWDPQFANAVGVPVGPAVDNGTHLTRAFASGAHVRYNRATGNASLVWASPAPPGHLPPPPTGCVDDWNCSLNGHCVSGACACNAPWSGAACDVLRIAPSPPDGPVIYGGSAGGVSSWGGSVFAGPDGKFHLFVAEIANGCGMAAWDTNSFVRHAVSDTINGTYVPADVAVPHWAHNPQAIEIRGELFIFHIGAGDGNSTLERCGHSDDGVEAPGVDAAISLKRRIDPHVAHIESAPGPDGPWSRVPGGPLCDNPSPWLMRNGTLLLMCSRSVGGGPGPHWRLYSAPSPRGPWNVVVEIRPDPAVTAPSTEDPFLWQDPAGNFHALGHGGLPRSKAVNPSPKVSAHAFSRDGVTWGWSSTAPYSSTVTFTNGSAVHYASAERPKLVLDGDGNPTHLINGLGPHPWPCDGCAWGNQTNVCNKCKLIPGIDATYTIMRQLV